MRHLGCQYGGPHQDVKDGHEWNHEYQRWLASRSHRVPLNSIDVGLSASDLAQELFISSLLCLLLHLLVLHVVRLLGEQIGLAQDSAVFLLLYWGGTFLLAELSFRHYERYFLGFRHKPLGRVATGTRNAQNKRDTGTTATGAAELERLGKEQDP